MKFPNFFKRNKIKTSHHLSNDDSFRSNISTEKIEYINWSEGYLFKDSIWMSRNKYLEKIHKIIGDGKCIYRDGRKTFYNTNSFISCKHKKSFDGLHDC